MKFKVTMKDPDKLQDAEADAVRADLEKIAGLTADDRKALYEVRLDAVREVTKQWFKYGEYLTVEIDTEAKTATVCAER